MRSAIHKRRTLNYCLLAALVLAQVAGFFALPRPAAAAISADPNAEIVYLDENGVIRVLDTEGDPLVQWFSPEGSWNNIALADVNDDGDMEIIAMDNQDEEFIRIAVYDPVVTSGSTNPNQQINGIPWDTLWDHTFGGDGEYLVAGDFDPNIPGDEFVTGFLVFGTSVVTVWNANSLGADGKPTGRDWKKHIEKEYPEFEYKTGAAGNLNGEGADELILVDSESTETRMNVYRPDRDMEYIDGEGSDRDRFKAAAAGQLREGGAEEPVAILTTDRPHRPALRTYELTDDAILEEDQLWAFAPQPDALFLADITGNGDDEVFFLRNYPEGEEGPRLLMRDEWGDDRSRNDDLIEWNLMDGGDENQFRAGAGADVDGDGRDEVIIMRDDRIRIYHRPETGREGSSDYTDHMLTTDDSRENLLAGDLDSIGFTLGPVLAYDRNLIEAIVPAGTMSSEFTVQISNIGTTEGVGISAFVPPGNGWAQVNPTFVTTPATVRVRFDASALSAGVYQTTMTLRTTPTRTDVQNDNHEVILRLTVVPPTLQPNPGALLMYRLPDEQATQTEPFTRTIQVRGSNDLSFKAAIIGVPPAPDGTASVASGGLDGAITGGEVDANGNLVLYDEQGNSRTLGADWASTAQAITTTVMLDPTIPWITGATLDSASTPAMLSIGIDPEIMTEDMQREHAVLILVADTRAGTPSQNITIVPIELANVNFLMWAALLGKE